MIIYKLFIIIYICLVDGKVDYIKLFKIKWSISLDYKCLENLLIKLMQDLPCMDNLYKIDTF